MKTIQTKIDPCEINGKERRGLPKDEDQLSIEAHWNFNTFVILKYHGINITVFAEDLRDAIDNATNH